MGYLYLHVFYTESTIFFAPGCGENTSSTSRDRMAGTIGPWDWYQAVDSQQSYIRARLYIHGPYLHTQTITGILHEITKSWYKQSSLHRSNIDRGSSPRIKSPTTGAKTGLHLIYTTATRPVRRCSYFTSSPSSLFLWVARSIMRRVGALGNGGEKVAGLLWGRRAGEDIVAAREGPGGDNAHRSPELFFPGLHL